jgi:hypothetical protein
LGTLEVIEAEIARQRQISCLKIGDEKLLPLVSNGANGKGGGKGEEHLEGEGEREKEKEKEQQDYGKTVEKVAKMVGISTRTYERAKPIIESKDEKLKDSVRSMRKD